MECCETFPRGRLEDHEGPDFLLHAKDQVIGIEITQLYQSNGPGEFPPRQVESFHDKIIRQAENLYSIDGGPAVDVRAYFSPHCGGKRNVEFMAQTIAKWVADRSGELSQVVLCTIPDAPEGITSMSIANAFDTANPSWWAGSGGSVHVLTAETVQAKVEQKSTKVDSYRRKVERVWLLLVVDLFPLSGSFSLPASASQWAFRSQFERILLYSAEDSQVFEFSTG